MTATVSTLYSVEETKSVSCFKELSPPTLYEYSLSKFRWFLKRAVIEDRRPYGRKEASPPGPAGAVTSLLQTELSREYSRTTHCSILSSSYPMARL